MTLKSLLWTDRKENLKRRVWPFSLFCILVLFLYPIRIAMMLERQSHYMADTMAIQKYSFVYLGFDECSMVVLALAAVISGLQGFSWLYERRKVDMYLSQPISMKRQFRIIYENGIYIYFIPHVIAKIISILVVKAAAGMTAIAFFNMLFSFLLELLYFLSVYSITLLAVMLCSQKIISGILTAIFLVYEPFFRYLYETYKASFLGSFYWKDADTGYYITPIMQASRLADYTQDVWDFASLNGNQVVATIWSKSLPVALHFLIIALLVSGIAYYCYLKRPMETAGSAIAFERVKGPLKVAICFLTGIFAGVGFYDLSYQKTEFGLIGLASGVIISQCVVEILYHSDLKAAFCGKKSLAIVSISAFLFYATFWLDLTGYDSYVPKQEEVDYSMIRIEFQNYYSKSYNAQDMEQILDAMYEMKGMEIQDSSVVLAIAGECMNHKQILEYRENSEDKLVTTVKYHLKNGKDVYRVFYIDPKQQEEELNALFSQEEYKDGTDISMSLDMLSNFDISQTNYYNGMDEYALSKTIQKELIDAYRKDYMNMTFSAVKEETPYGVLEISYWSDGWEQILQYPVFPTYQRVIGLLEEQQLELLPVIDSQSLSGITVNNYIFDEASIQTVAPEDCIYYEAGTGQLPDYISHTYEEQEVIGEILQDVCLREMKEYNYLYDSGQGKGIDLELILAKDGATWQNGRNEAIWAFRTNKVPDYVISDLGVIKGE